MVVGYIVQYMSVNCNVEYFECIFVNPEVNKGGTLPIFQCCPLCECKNCGENKL